MFRINCLTLIYYDSDYYVQSLDSKQTIDAVCDERKAEKRRMLLYYLIFTGPVVVFTVAVTVILLLAISRSESVKASFWASRFGFSLQAQHKSNSKKR